MSAKPKAVYFYPFQIWLTSAFIGPIFLFISTQMNGHSLFSFLEFYWLAAILGFVLSFPSFILLLAGVIIVDWRFSRIYVKKFIIAIWAIVLAIAPVFLISGSLELLLQKYGLTILGSYLGPLLAAVFLFSWPHGE